MLLRPRAVPPGFIAPCLPTSAPQPPFGALWLHEIKHDGFRVSLARTAGALVRQQVLWEHWGVGNPPTQDVLRVPISGHGLRGLVIWGRLLGKRALCWFALLTLPPSQAAKGVC
jgi:hypothetical protein